MTNKQYFDAITHGHFLYWDMLGDLRGIKNHKEDKLRWTTGDIIHTYFTSSVEMDDVINRMKDGEIPKNLFFLFDDSDTDAIAPFLSSGLFRKNSETSGMAHKLCDVTLPKLDKCINLFRVREISQLKAAGAI